MILDFGLRKMRYFVKIMNIQIEGGCQEILWKHFALPETTRKLAQAQRT